MLGFGNVSPFSETEADAETARVYRIIRQVLRVSGVNLNPRTRATFEKLLPLLMIGEPEKVSAELRAFL